MDPEQPPTQLGARPVGQEKVSNHQRHNSWPGNGDGQDPWLNPRRNSTKENVAEDTDLPQGAGVLDLPRAAGTSDARAAGTSDARAAGTSDARAARTSDAFKAALDARDAFKVASDALRAAKAEDIARQESPTSDPEKQPLLSKEPRGRYGNGGDSDIVGGGKVRRKRWSDLLPPDAQRTFGEIFQYDWQKEKWTPQRTRGSAKLHLVAVSAFANIAPVGCMVVSRPTTGILPSIVLMVFFMSLSLFGAYLLSSALTISRCHTLPGLWREVIGVRTAAIPILSIAAACFGCTVGYMTFYGHLLAFAFNFKSPIHRVLVCEEIYIVASAIPLAVIVCLKDLSMMRYSTYITLVAVLLCLLVVVVRFVDGSYEPYTGQFDHYHDPWTMPKDHVATVGELSTYAGVNPGHTVSLQAVLFLWHFNGAKYFRELEFKSKDKFLYAVGAAAGLAFIVVGAIMVLVFLQFGQKASVVTFDNYSPNDKLANAARIIFSIGIMGCFPLLFAGMREALVEFLHILMPSRKEQVSTVLFQNIFSLILLTCVTVVTIVAQKADLRLNNIGRCVFGTLLIYVIPPIVWYAAVAKYTSHSISWCRTVILLFMVVVGLALSGSSLVMWMQATNDLE